MCRRWRGDCLRKIWTFEQKCSIFTTTREQFLQALRRYCRKNGIAFEILANRGKGSHYRVRVGDAETIVPSGEISPVMRRVILIQLGLPKDAHREI